MPNGNPVHRGAIIVTATNRFRTAARRAATAAVAWLALTPLLAVEQEMPIDHRLNEQVIMIPAGAADGAMLQTTVFRPNGDGPFPLLIINHGKEAGAPGNQARDRFIFMATAFVKRGYAVVIPRPRGFSKPTGDYIDPGCNMPAHGQLQAADRQGALEYLRTQPWVDPDRIVVAGQSYGGTYGSVSWIGRSCSWGAATPRFARSCAGARPNALPNAARKRRALP